MLFRMHILLRCNLLDVNVRWRAARNVHETQTDKTADKDLLRGRDL